MSDTTPDPERTVPIHAEAPGEPAPRPANPADPAPAPAPAPASAAVAEPVAPRRPGGRWRNRRVPVLIAAAAVLLGCLVGGGAVAIGAALLDHDRPGDVRMVDEDGRFDRGPGGPGHRGGPWERGERGERGHPRDRQPAPAPSGVPSAPAVPSPAVPSPAPATDPLRRPPHRWGRRGDAVRDTRQAQSPGGTSTG